MSKLEDWVDRQLRMIQGTSRACLFRLKGPDQSTWGTWTHETPELAATIQGTIAMLADELPKGRHAVTVWSYDEAGNELAMLPQAIHGVSDAATSAAAEQMTLQKATSAAIHNAEILNEGLRRQIAHLNEAISETSKNNVELLDTVQTLVAEHAQREMKEHRRDKLDATFHLVCDALGQHAPLLIELLMQRLKGKPAADAIVKHVNSTPAAPPTPPTLPPQQTPKAPTNGTGQKPSDGTDSDHAIEPRRAETSGSRGSKAERGATSARARKSSSGGRRKPVRKPVRRSSRNP